jgi:hypothetical protein
MPTMPDVFQTALSLPESERAELACQIILSLGPMPVTGSLASSPKSLEEIIQARAARVASGEYQSYSIDETMARVRNAMQRESSK